MAIRKSIDIKNISFTYLCFNSYEYGVIKIFIFISNIICGFCWGGNSARYEFGIRRVDGVFYFHPSAAF